MQFITHFGEMHRAPCCAGQLLIYKIDYAFPKAFSREQVRCVHHHQKLQYVCDCRIITTKSKSKTGYVPVFDVCQILLAQKVLGKCISDM